MEETKIDKAIDKLLRFVEKHSNNVINLAKRLISSKKLISHYHIFWNVILISYLIIFPICLIYNIYYKGWSSIFTFLWISFGYSFGYCLYQLHLLNQQFFASFDIRLLRISSVFFMETVVNNCFKPIVADWREEYPEAVNGGNKWHARRISVYYTYAFILAMMQQSVLRRFVEFIRFFTK